MAGRGRAVHVKRPEKPKPRKKVGQPESDSDSSQYGSVSHTPPPSVNGKIMFSHSYSKYTVKPVGSKKIVQFSVGLS